MTKASEKIRFAANCSLLFTEQPLLERPSHAAAAGFTAIELWWPFRSVEPDERELRELEAAIRDAGVELVALNYFAGDMAAGVRGILAEPGRVEEFRSGVKAAHRLGERLGCRTFNALVGIRAADASEAQSEAAVTNLVFAARAAAELDAVVLLEALSAAPGYPLRSVEDVRATIADAREHGAPDNIRMLFDIYHLAANGASVADAISDASGIVGHVQVADHPGRGEPGSGALPIDDLLSQLVATGYAGYVGVEYVPTTTTEESLGWLRQSTAYGAQSRP